MNRDTINVFLRKALGEEEQRKEGLHAQFSDEKRKVLTMTTAGMAVMGFAMFLFVAYLLASPAGTVPIIPIGTAGITVIVGGTATARFTIGRLFRAGEELANKTAETLFSHEEVVRHAGAQLHASLGMRMIYQLYYVGVPHYDSWGRPSAINWQDSQVEAGFLEWMDWHMASPDSNLVVWVMSRRMKTNWRGDVTGLLDGYDPMLTNQHSQELINQVVWRVLSALGVQCHPGRQWSEVRSEALKRLSDYLDSALELQRSVLELNTYQRPTIIGDDTP